MYPFDDEGEDDFYSRDYSSPRRASVAFDPFGDINTDIVGVTKKFGADGKFIENEDIKRRKRLFSSEHKETKTESELAPMVESGKYADDYSWWRKETGYRAWLKNQNLDPDKLDSFTGNKLFTEYIKFKAENPEGFMKFSSDVMGAIGGVIQGVSNTLSKVPGIKTVAKPVGSILQFIGNLADMPRNILAGAFTAVSTNNPEEILPNMWEAMKFSVGEVVGNEGTGKDVGRYFSWMDGQLMNMVEKAKQGMSEQEYKEYIDSDSFRHTKRLWQTGGMLLDLIADPMWFTGAGEAKALKAMRELKLGKEAMGVLVDNVVNLSKGGFAQAIEKAKAFETVAERIDKFVSGSEKLIDFVKADKAFLEKLGMDGIDFSKYSRVDLVETLVSKFDGLAKGDLKGFEYALRFKIPFVNRALGGMKIGPSMPKADNLAEKIIGKMSGQPNPVLSVAGRAPERSALKVNLFGDVNRAIFEDGKKLEKALDDMAKDLNPEIRAAAEEAKRNPVAYDELVSSLLESNTTLAPFAFLDVPGAATTIKKSLFAVNEPLFKTILTHPAIEEIRKDIDKVLSDSFGKVSKSQEYNLNLARMYGMSDELAYSVGLDDKTLQGLYKADASKIREEALSFGEAVKKINEEGSNVSKRFGPGAEIPYRELSKRIEGEYTKYYPKVLTDEAAEYFRKQITKNGAKEWSIGMDQMITDYMQHVYIATDTGNTFLQDLVFGPEKAVKFRQLLIKSPTDAFRDMNIGIRELYHNDPDTFKKLTQWSNVMDENGIPFNMNDIPPKFGVGKDVRPLISKGSVSLLNEYARNGLLFANFKGTLYKGGFEPIYNKILKDQQIIDRLESVNTVLQEGQKGGWLRKLKNESDLINYDQTWRYQDNGIFKGFVVKDYLEKPLANATRGMLNIAEYTTDSWATKKGKELLGGFASWWKVNVFIKNPGAQPRNFISNRIMMWGLGIHPWNVLSKEAYEGRKVWKYYRAAEKYQESIMKVGVDSSKLKSRMIQLGSEKVIYEGKSIPIMEATEYLLQNNTLGNGFINTMIDGVRKMDDSSEYEKFKKMATDSNRTFVRRWNPFLYFFGKNDEYAKKFKDIGGLVENAYGRLETFFTLTNKNGMSASEAAIKVNETLIDYGRISKMEDVIRRYIYPFYTWQTRMIPIMLQKVLEQPAFFSKITQLKNNAYHILELDKNFAPRGEEVMEGVPSVSLDPTNLGKFFTGKPMNEIKTQYFSGEGWLPQAVVNLFEPSKLKNLISPEKIEDWAPIETAVNIGKGALDYVVSGLSPMIKLPIEASTGYSFQYKKMLQAYPDQTVEFLGMHMSPGKVNIIRSVFGTLREADDVISIWEENAITGQPKYTVYDVLWKNLIGYRPYNRNEIREVTGALGELRQIRQSNLSDAKKMVYDQPQAQRHAKNALMAYHAIEALEWYKDFLTEVRDKEATARGIQLDIADIEEKLANHRLNKKQIQKYEEKKMSLYERLEAFIADQEKL